MQALLARILTFILMLQSLFGLIGEKYTVYENIRYGEAERALVTIYVPHEAAKREENGCILYIHGGSWTGGEKEDMSPHCKKLAMKGYIAATMSYSLCSEEAFGEALRLAQEISPVSYVNARTLPSVFAYAGNDPIVTKGNRESMVRTFENVFGKNGNNDRYVFYPLSGHGLLLDPISERKYDQAVFDYCKTYFGY